MIMQPKRGRMTVAEFLNWAMAQPRGRYELVQGEVVAMPAERAGHNLLKAEVALALERAIERAGLPYLAVMDGMAVVIDDKHVREPDAAGRAGWRLTSMQQPWSRPSSLWRSRRRPPRAMIPALRQTSISRCRAFSTI